MANSRTTKSMGHLTQAANAYQTAGNTHGLASPAEETFAAKMVAMKRQKAFRRL